MPSDVVFSSVVLPELLGQPSTVLSSQCADNSGICRAVQRHAGAGSRPAVAIIVICIRVTLILIPYEAGCSMDLVDIAVAVCLAGANSQDTTPWMVRYPLSR